MEDGRLTVHKRVEDGHGTVGDTSVRVDLLEDCRSGKSVLRSSPSDQDASKVSACARACKSMREPTFVDVRGVSLLAGLGALLLFTGRGGGGLLAGLLLLSGRFAASWGLASSAGLLLGGFGRHVDDG